MDRRTNQLLAHQLRWRTRIELANAIFEYLEILHNRQRRHTALKMRTPIEYEKIHHHNLTAAPLIQVN
jgi:transposase InsO family protein